MLSLAVALTFIPLTAGFAFAAEPTVVEVDLSYANSGNNVPGIGKQLYVNFNAPWQNGNDIVHTVGKNGTNLKPVVANVKIPKIGSSTSGYQITLSQDEWIEAGEYTFTMRGDPNVPFLTVTEGENVTNYMLTGEYTETFKIVDASNLAGATVELEYDAVDYDGQVHQPAVTKVTDAAGTVVDPSYYEVKYPDTSTNAYAKPGSFPIEVIALTGNAGNYKGKAETKVTINDIITEFTVYSMAGKNGEKKKVKAYSESSWAGLAKNTALQWGYKTHKYTSTDYIPLESLLADAGLGTIGQFNDKDAVVLWTNSTPELYTLREDYIFGEIKDNVYTRDGKKITSDIFADESTIPAFLILDTIDRTTAPMMGIGCTYNSETGEYDTPGGFNFARTVSEVVFRNMNINGLSSSSVANATYTGKAQTPAVTVKDGDVSVPVTVAYKNNTNAGTATVTVTAKADSDYYGTITKTFKINKAGNTLTVKAKKAPKVKRSKIKKKAQKVAASKVMTASNYKGTLTYAKVSGSKRLTIAKNGQVTVKKKTKKGTYKMKVKVTAGDANYESVSKNVTIKVRVK